MADVIPFRALRPKAEYAACVSTLPYDVYNEDEARAVISENPFSFLSVVRPEAAFDKGISCDKHMLYEKAHDILYSYLQRGIFIQDKTPCFYIYRLTEDKRSHTGIVGLVSVDDYLNGCIKKHENTRTDKEMDRACHIEACKAQTGPVFMAYHTDFVLKELITENTQKKPVYDFVSEDRIRHQVWCVSDGTSIERLQEGFIRQNSLYIADGHHRCAAAAATALKQRKLCFDYDRRAAFNYILSVFFQEDELTIMDYNRVVNTLGGYDEAAFLRHVSNIFSVKKIGTNAVKPQCKGQIAMYMKDIWYLLQIPDMYYTGNPVKDLDISILHEQLLEPLLHIKNPKTDTHIDFVGGIKGLEGLEQRVHTDMKAAFALYPVNITELFAVADCGLLMPPKSTWFEPKLRSGLFIHTIK